MESGALVGLGVLATVVIDVESGVRFSVFRGLPDYATITYWTALCDLKSTKYRGSE